MTKKSKNSSASNPAYKPPAQEMSLTKKVDRLLKMIPRGTFETVGGAVGGPTGAAIGKGISTITGYGDYTVTSNSLGLVTQKGELANSVPSFEPSDHGTRIRHREFIGNVFAPPNPNVYSVKSYNIMASNPELFPWVSEIALRYQRYKVHGMVFYYVSTSTDYNNSGTVAICTNYNVNEREFGSMQTLQNSMFAVSTKPSLSMAAPIECEPKSMPSDGYFVRHQEALADGVVSDLRLSTLGKLNVATEGLTLPEGTILGQLWVTYDLELLHPYSGVDSIVPESFASTAYTVTPSQTTYKAISSSYKSTNWPLTLTSASSASLEWEDKPNLIGAEYEFAVIEVSNNPGANCIGATTNSDSSYGATFLSTEAIPANPLASEYQYSYVKFKITSASGRVNLVKYAAAGANRTVTSWGRRLKQI